MANLETVANPVAVTTVSACVLGVGFMFRFLVALTLEKKNSAHALRPRGVKSQTEIACATAPSRMLAVSPAAYVAMGVVKITTALASNAGRRSSDLSWDRVQVIRLDRPNPEINFTSQHRHRSSRI